MGILEPMSRRSMAVWCAAIAAGLGLCWAIQWCGRQLDAGEALSADTLRLHVRAASDTVEDQTMKLRVRDAILELADEKCQSGDKEETLEWAARSLPLVELKARCALAAHGRRAEVRVRLVNMYFGTSRYSGAALPAGRYDALRVELGDEKNYGKNWWCVLYPGLCRSACGDYARQEENDLVRGEYILRFAVVDWWQSRTAVRGDTVMIGL